MPDKSNNLYMLLSNPISGEEAAYNEWYSDHHLREILTLSKFVAAQRFIASPERFQRSSEPKPSPSLPPHKYMAIYETPVAPREALDSLTEAMDSGGLTPSVGLAPGTVSSFWTPFTPRLEG